MDVGTDGAERHVHIVGDLRQWAILDQRLAGNPLVGATDWPDCRQRTTDLVAMDDFPGGVRILIRTFAKQIERESRTMVLARPLRRLTSSNSPEPGADFTGLSIGRSALPDGEKRLLQNIFNGRGSK